MRNRYYEEVYYAFRALTPGGDPSAPGTYSGWFQHLTKEIKHYERLLMTCLEYAQAAVFYGKADNATLYSKDKRWGILQEEIFLVHFLQELLSTTRYIISRIETDRMLQQWSPWEPTSEFATIPSRPASTTVITKVDTSLPVAMESS